LEVSSYQLEITPNFHPHIALLLNITPDHLDRYASYDEYIAAKELIVRNLTAKDHFIYNEEDPLVKKIAKKTKAKKTGFATEEIGSRKSEVRSPTSDFSPLLLTIDLSRAKIKGQHNKENIIAAVLAAGVAGCSAEAVQRVIETFKGLPHRNQFVREVSGVKYFDDSKGTNVGAVVKSLEGFDSKVVLIAGGLDKGGSYDPLRPLIKEKVKALVLIGTAKDKIANELGDLTKVVKAGSMADAVREASALALTGDVVLLSPACASFDMFKDYADRGNKFAEEVKKL
jgi:UDP-N-acetylmuramoylalanine--D-glutamate ligase